MKTDVAIAIEVIRLLALQKEPTIDDAARKFYSEQPRLTGRVLDRIGSWPSSEPELAALQRVAR